MDSASRFPQWGPDLYKQHQFTELEHRVHDGDIIVLHSSLTS
jgi:hypothetical protein